MKERVTVGTDGRFKDRKMSHADDSESVIEVNKSGVAEIHEKHQGTIEGKPGEMPSGPEAPYDVTRAHGSTRKP